MDEYTIKITSQTEKQLQEIIHCITHELKAPEAALHLLDALEKAFASLEHFPQRVALVDSEGLFLCFTGLRSIYCLLLYR